MKKKRNVITAPSLRILNPSRVADDIHDDLWSQNEELRQAQDDLELSNARYTDLYDCAPVAYVTFDRSGLIHAANFAAGLLLGCERIALVRTPFAVHVARPDISKFLEHLQRCRKSQAPVRVELLARQRSGLLVPVELHTAALPDHPGGGMVLFRTTIIDLTERKHAEEILRESEARYRVLAEALPVFIRSADPDGTVDYCNRHWFEFSGLSPAQNASGKWIEIIHPEDRDALKEKCNEAVEHVRNVELEIRYLRKADSAHLWHVCRIFPLKNPEGKVYKVLSIATDIQRRKEAEAERERLLVELKKERAGLAARVRERTAVLNRLNKKLSREISERKRLEKEILDISEQERRRLGQDLHDSLCQQIQGSALLAGTLSQRLANKDSAEATNAMQIARLLKESVVEARALARGLYPLALDSEGLVLALRELAANAGTSLDCRFECRQAVKVGDGAVALNFYRIAQEALNNAIKHARARRAVIKLQRKNEKLLLTVNDDGIGLPETFAKSKGMGFHIMSYRARMIGASLMISSRKGAGTTIFCSLPDSKIYESKSKKP